MSGVRKLLVSLVVVPLFALSATARPVPTAAQRAWGFDRSDLVPHPGVRFGVLANGMRYAIMTAGPGTGLSIRMRVAAGSSVEGTRQVGFMHLIEHLVFHGSNNVPPGGLLLMLQHQGIKRWADFNAFTTFDQTVYRLDLPRADRGSRDTASMLMREIATELRFAHRTVAGAKEDVTQEIAARDAVGDRVTAEQNAFLLPGTTVARETVTGTQASVRRASRTVLKRLYARHYVPGQATLVLVGDFDADVVEAEIGTRFGDWPATPIDPADGVPPSPPPPPVVRTPDVRARLFVDTAAPTRVTIATVRPLGGADAGARRDALFLEHIAGALLGRRLAQAGARADAPFAEANTAVYDHFSTARLALIELTARDRDWARALQAGAAELQRVIDAGFSQTELDAQTAASAGALAAAAAPRTTAAMADAIIDAVGRGIVFTAPADVAATAAYLAHVRVADVNAAFRGVWAPPHSLFVSHDRRVPDAPAAIAAAWARGLHAGGASGKPPANPAD